MDTISIAYHEIERVRKEIILDGVVITKGNPWSVRERGEETLVWEVSKKQLIKIIGG